MLSVHVFDSMNEKQNKMELNENQYMNLLNDIILLDREHTGDDYLNRSEIKEILFKFLKRIDLLYKRKKIELFKPSMSFKYKEGHLISISRSKIVVLYIPGTDDIGHVLNLSFAFTGNDLLIDIYIERIE